MRPRPIDAAKTPAGIRIAAAGTAVAAVRALAGALASLAALGHPPSDALLDTYAEAADLISEHDVGSIQESDRAGAAEHPFVSTLLLEPVLLTLRRIAQENASRRSGR